MFIRSFSSLSAVALIMAIAGSAQAEQGLPSQSMLHDMGLSGIEVMTDTDAMAIRGFGYAPSYYDTSKPVAIAYGQSYASISGYGGHARSKDGFYAQSRRNASGEHGSYAGLIVKHSPKRRHGGGFGDGGGGFGGGGGGFGGGGGYEGGGGHPRPQPRPHVKKVVVFAGGFSYASTD